MTPQRPEAVSSRHETPSELMCAAGGCANPLPVRGPGRPARFCSQACRARAYRQRRRQPRDLVVDVALGSTSSKGRTQGRVWMVRLRRDAESVIVAIGLSRGSAEALAERITELL